MLTCNSLIEIEPHTAITIEKNIMKVTRNSKILKIKPKDRDSNFLVLFSSSKA